VALVLEGVLLSHHLLQPYCMLGTRYKKSLISSGLPTLTKMKVPLEFSFICPKCEVDLLVDAPVAKRPQNSSGKLTPLALMLRLAARVTVFQATAAAENARYLPVFYAKATTRLGKSTPSMAANDSLNHSCYRTASRVSHRLLG